jgi:valyl-tRNA synthetase
MAARYPQPDTQLLDEAAETELARAIGAVQSLRAWRERIGAAPGKAIPARLEARGYDDTAEHVARLARLEWGDDGDPVATITVPGGAIAVFASDAVDLDAAARRAAAHRAVLESEITRAERKLANEGFVAKAPAAVVQAERDKLAGLRQELEELG